jgi:Holliday junction resolvasome RuvABC endonuclease subunit
VSLLGLDLSARAAAAVAVPLDWDGQWRRIKTLVVGEALGRGASDRDRALRCGYIAERIAEFARRHQVAQAWIEGYAFNQNTAAHTVAEVGGVVRLELVRAGIEVRTANMQTARKLLLGKLPPRGKKVIGKKVSAKDAVVATLRAAGAAFKTVDEYDGFTAANLGMSDVGAFFYGQAL